MRTPRSPLWLAALLGLTILPAGAQIAASGAGVPLLSTSRVGVDPSPARAMPIALRPQLELGKKSPFVAGVLSVIPGAGSFYAGNSSHGWRHLLLAGGTLVAIPIVGGLGCVAWASADSGARDSTGCLDKAFNVGTALYIGNWAWSIFTAVKDVRVHNARTVGSDVR